MMSRQKRCLHFGGVLYVKGRLCRTPIKKSGTLSPNRDQVFFGDKCDKLSQFAVFLRGP
jgi:hypothetical protein